MIAGRGPTYGAMSGNVLRKHGCRDRTKSTCEDAIGCLQAAQWRLQLQIKPQAT